ncbi:GGDEF domain-containing protein [Pseudoduganella sp. LjRoot289]|uniref:GGDEF domain-containing protein n=1 Tax=Pseudoduganella sp. LjRoot289 TaxID=3342314 RepID=UPI003ED0E8AF
MLGLIVLTISLLVWQHFGMERVMIFSSASGRAVETIDDRDEQGDSVASVTRRPDALVMDCELRKSLTYPYCLLVFPLSRSDAGVDMSEFDFITVDMSYEGPSTPEIGLTLWNFESGLSKVGDTRTHKVIEVQFEVPAQGTVHIPIKVLNIAPWWLKKMKVPMQRSDVRIDNVTGIVLGIGSGYATGHHRLVLRSLKFHGKLISQNRLLMMLVCGWILAALSWLAYSLLLYRAKLGTSTARLALLSQLNSALELEASELADRAFTDELTGALNRKGLRDALMNKWRKADTADDAMAVVFVDIDHFKSVNDTYGHDVGDQVLRAFAAAVQREIRASDKLVRWGGEEFLIVCLSCGAAEAQGLADKLRRAMHHQIWPCGMHLTASFGVTALGEGEDIGDTIKRADAALYQAKSEGRDCVKLA